MTKRRRLTKLQKIEARERVGGICYLCGLVLNPARHKIEYDHPVAFKLGGANGKLDLQPVHAECHAKKTPGDVKQIAKAKRVAAKHEGTYRPSRSPMPCGRNSGWTKPLHGNAVRRKPKDWRPQKWSLV